MMDFLNFTFRNLWTYFGVIMLIICIGYAVYIAFSGLKGFIHVGDDIIENHEEIPSGNNKKSENDLDH